MNNIEFVPQQGKVPSHFRVPDIKMDDFRKFCGAKFPSTMFKESRIFIGNTRLIMVEALFADLSVNECTKLVQEYNTTHGTI